MNRQIDNYYSRERRELLALLPESLRPAKVLDVGCGEGATARILKEEFGAETVIGIEKDKRAAQRAASVLDRVHRIDAEAEPLPFAEQEFDLILFADVLEHLRHPWDAVKRYSRLLRKDGLILSSLPNAQHWSLSLKLLMGRWSYTDGGLLDRTHLRFFTRRSIEPLFEPAGLKIERVHCKMGPEVRILNLFTAGLFRGLLTFQYLVRARRTQSG